MEIVHTPVLLNECIEMLSPLNEPYENHPVMIDSTLGEGGHSFNFLKKYPKLQIIGIDADCIIQEKAKNRLQEFGSRMKFYNGWFNDFYENYPTEFEKPNLILFDLGISVFHYEKSQRGFSFRYDEKLDMRLNKNSEISAYDIVNNFEEKKLADIIYLYGEEKLSRKIANAIVNARNNGKIESSKQLAQIIWDCVPSSYRYQNIHPATRTFQALRICVNNELKRIPDALDNAFKNLRIGGKMGVITFHSLEDRIVKNYFRNLSKKCICPQEFPVCRCGGTECAILLNKKPIIPTEQEIQNNSPSRSAKLRVIRKIKDATQYHLNGVIGY